MIKLTFKLLGKAFHFESRQRSKEEIENDNLIGYKCKKCGAKGLYSEFPTISSEEFKDIDICCKNPDCEGKDEDLEDIKEYKN